MIHYLRALAARVRGLFGDRRADRELDGEIEEHLRLLTERYLRQGMPEAEAASAARRQFGNITLLREAGREMRGLRLIDNLFQNVRYGVRMLWRNPGFTLVAVITLALGIGANTAIFSMLEGVVLAPLPYRDVKRLVAVLQSRPGTPRGTPSGPDFREWQRNAGSFEQMAGFRWRVRDLTNPGAPAHLDGREISSGFFSILGVNLSLGREFSSQEDARGGDPVVIISDRLWQDRFGGSREVLGRSVTLDGVDHTIVGVLPSGFKFGWGHGKRRMFIRPLGRIIFRC